MNLVRHLMDSNNKLFLDSRGGNIDYSDIYYLSRIASGALPQILQKCLN